MAPHRVALVGRDDVLDVLDGWLATNAVRMIHVTGPAGAGKTAVGLALAQRLTAAGAKVGWAPAPELGMDVWFVDADDPAPHALLAGLADTQRVVVLSRRSLSAGSIADPDLAASIRSYALPPLAPGAARELGERLGLDAAEASAVATRAEGWPLLIVAEAERLRAARSGHGVGASRRMPLRLGSREVRDALFAAALVQSLTEPLLAAMLQQDASSLFDTLISEVPFARRAMGITLPVALRDLVLDELALRTPELRSGLTRRAQEHLLALLDRAALDEIPRLASELVFACRFEPYAAELAEVIAPPLEPDGVEAAHRRARAAIVKFEGEASARLFDVWRGTSWATLIETRGREGEPRGFVLQLALHPDAAYPPGDPVVDALVRATRAAGRPFASHERIHVGRFWLDYDRYQDVRPSISAWADLIATGAVVGASVHRNAPVWLSASVRPFKLLAQASVDGMPYAVFGLDRRCESVATVFARLVEAWRTGATHPDDDPHELASPLGSDPVSVLDRASLAPPLRAALRAFSRADVLGRNPLVRLHWVNDLTRTGQRPAAALAQRLEELVASVGDSGHDGLLARTLSATFLVDAPKGRVVAEELGMGYSTYRRWLREALDRATDLLVVRESAARRPR